MFRIMAGSTRNSERLVRRSFVQAGLLGVAGLTLPQYFELRAKAAIPGENPSKNSLLGDRSGNSVILIWMSGGPGHHETWDPKPQAVSQFRGPFGAISTSLPGVQFSETCPEQAKIAQHVSILRSLKHGTGDHTKANHWMLTGFEGPDFNKSDNRIQRRPSMGSVAAAVRSARRNHAVVDSSAQSEMPPYVATPHLRGGTDNLFHYATYLGGVHNPFVLNSDPNSPDFRVSELALSRDLTFDRLQSRQALLKSMDEFRRNADQQMTDMSEHQQSAFQLLTGPKVREAFQIGSEPEHVRDAYGRHTFGQSALLARRLVERGVSFVTVNTQPWDHHGTANRLPTESGAKQLIPPTDMAIAALIRDLIDRGLYEKTLVVAMGEFGRTPKMNPEGGRDHWGHAFSVLIGGGGMPAGQVIGSTDEHAAYVTNRPLSPQDVTATVYHHLGIDSRLMTFPDRFGRPMHLVENGNPIRELTGEV